MPECQTVLEVATENNFTILGQAIAALNLTDTFNDTGLEVTVFAPTDEAFMEAIEKLDTTAEDLLANTELLSSVLNTHVVEAYLELQTWTAKTLNTNQNLTITPTVSADNTAKITTPGVRACHSVIYPIDAVLLPSATTE